MITVDVLEACGASKDSIDWFTRNKLLCLTENDYAQIVNPTKLLRKFKIEKSVITNGLVSNFTWQNKKFFLEYDSHDRLEYHSDGDYERWYSYLSDGKRFISEDSNGVKTFYYYNMEGQVYLESAKIGNAFKRIFYGYDSQGRLKIKSGKHTTTKIKYLDGKTIFFKESPEGATKTICVSDNYGNYIRVETGNKSLDYAYTYYRNGQLKSVNDCVIPKI